MCTCMYMCVYIYNSWTYTIEHGNSGYFVLYYVDWYNNIIKFLIINTIDLTLKHQWLN